MRYLNPWSSDDRKLEVYDEDNIVYVNGDYAIVAQQAHNAHLYVYKDMAFGCRVGADIELLDRVATRNRPTGDYSPMHFSYDRCIENLERAVVLKGIHRKQFKQ